MGKALQRDYYNHPKSMEVEGFVKNNQNDLSVSNMATISGLKGQQFGHEVFVSLIKFKDMKDFLAVFPNVQRNVIKRKVSKIKNYILTYLNDPKNSMRFFPAITVTARGNVFHDETTNRLAIDTHNSKLSVNDGQHRFFGIDSAIAEIEKRIEKAKESHIIERYEQWIADLNEMVIPMTMFNNLTEEEEKQLFHDSNQLPQRPSRSANIRLVQSDNKAKLARELSEENRYLNHFGVEMNKMSIHNINPNTVLLTTVYAMIKNLHYQEFMVDNDFIVDENYAFYKKRINETLDNLFYNLPHDLDEKGKYLIEKSYTLRAIARFIHQSRLNNIKDSDIFGAIKAVDWSQNINKWEHYGAYYSHSGFFVFKGGNYGGENAIVESLQDALKGGRTEQVEFDL